MPLPITERACFVAAIRHLIDNAPGGTTKKKIARAADLSPPYLTQILKMDRGHGFDLYERLANACGITVAQAITLGARLLNAVPQETAAPRVAFSDDAITLFPQLPVYVGIVNQACAAGDQDLARSSLQHLARSTEDRADHPLRPVAKTG